MAKNSAVVECSSSTMSPSFAGHYSKRWATRDSRWSRRTTDGHSALCRRAFKNRTRKSHATCFMFCPSDVMERTLRRAIAVSDRLRIYSMANGTPCHRSRLDGRSRNRSERFLPRSPVCQTTPISAFSSREIEPQTVKRRPQGRSTHSVSMRSTTVSACSTLRWCVVFDPLARNLGLQRPGLILPGAVADLVVLDVDYQVVQT